MSKHKEATMTTTDQQIVRTELVEKVFGSINTDLPASLAAALENLSRLAVEMKPDDIHLQLDLVAGVLNFRCYRRAEVRT